MTTDENHTMVFPFGSALLCSLNGKTENFCPVSLKLPMPSLSSLSQTVKTREMELKRKKHVSGGKDMSCRMICWFVEVPVLCFVP